jgi:hypothetical protein
MNQYEITYIHPVTREEIHSIAWGNTGTEAAKAARQEMKKDPARKGWMLEIKVPLFG